MEEDKVPVEKVIDDMLDPNGGMVSSAARDYYYRNYATEEERIIMDIMMDRESLILRNMIIVCSALCVIAIILGIVSECVR